MEEGARPGVASPTFKLSFEEDGSLGTSAFQVLGHTAFESPT